MKLFQKERAGLCRRCATKEAEMCTAMHGGDVLGARIPRHDPTAQRRRCAERHAWQLSVGACAAGALLKKLQCVLLCMAVMRWTCAYRGVAMGCHDGAGPSDARGGHACERTPTTRSETS